MTAHRHRWTAPDRPDVLECADCGAICTWDPTDRSTHPDARREREATPERKAPPERKPSAGWEGGDREVTSDPRESLATVIATSSRDWSLDRGDAWIYGIVLGWGDAMSEVAERHGWTRFDVLRLHRLRRAFRKSDAP